MENFAGLYTAVQGLMERSDTNLLTKIKEGLNMGWRLIRGKRPWFATLSQTTFTSVAGLDYFITDQNVEMIIDLSQHNSPVVLGLQRYSALLSRSVDIIATTGFPTTASPSGDIGIKVALPSAGVITMVSNSALDTTQKARIRGFDSTTLVPLSEELSYNGTSTVTSSNSYSAKEGYEPRFSKDSTTTGTTTFARAGTTIAEIAPRNLEVRYRKWKVFPVFSSSITMYLTFKHVGFKLENDDDVPDLECDNALILYAYAHVLREKRQLAKAKEVYGSVDMNGFYNPGSFMYELDQLIANEPQFSENFTDQFLPIIERDGIDMPGGQTGFQLWPSS